MHVTKAFALQKAQRFLHLTPLLPDDMRAEVAIGAAAVSILTDPFWNIENDCYRKHVMLPCQLDERLPRFGLNVGSIDDRQQTSRKALRCDVMQKLEGGLGRALIVLVVRDEATTEVGRQRLEWLEVLSRKRRLSAPRRTDQDHQRQLRNPEHALLVPIGPLLLLYALHALALKLPFFSHSRCSV
jgi:hypothetical protein